MLDNPVKTTEVSVKNRIDLAVVPLKALSSRTWDLLAELLNHKRIFTSEDGYFRDWRGVFDMVGIPKNFLPLVSTNANPTRRLLELWQSENHQCKLEANLAVLQHVLGCIDRWDILDDTSKMFEQDAEQFLIREQKRVAKSVNETDEKVSNVGADSDIITKDDTPDHKQQYDAFILYADADIEFASKMVERLEARGMQLCLKDRDILGGSNFEHEVISRLISERCRRVVVIISKAFLESPLNDFTVTFAQALQIEKKERKVIPCVYDRCELPPHLRYTCRLDYQRSQNLYNFWDKLADSIRDTPRKVGVEMNVREAPEQKTVNETKSILPSAPRPIPKVIVEEPTLVVKMPSPMDQESRSGSLKKSHSFWDLFSSFSHKKDKLNGSTTTLNSNDAVPSTSPKKTSSSPLALIRRDKKQTMVGSGGSSAPSECPLEQPTEKPAKAKKKWYKPSSRKVATAV
ncbi:myeloid differentiation primary response protein MyD88 [Anopheles maculipalpis]|uniref:myeloid differentiation primary response protein MyD88 n=1 Tax=Anopheles maculipalpis TaxID=1496333 RepID=UPI002158D61F|nr:myeloid differentiation primary response protein MyD88 [Anopheles maculipalpis]